MPFLLVLCKMCGIVHCTGQLEKNYQCFICVDFCLEWSGFILKAETWFPTPQAVGIDQKQNSKTWNYTGICLRMTLQNAQSWSLFFILNKNYYHHFSRGCV